MSPISAVMKNAARRWIRFWFESEGMPQLRLFRVSFGILLACFFATRTLDAVKYYGPEGMLPLETLKSVIDRKFITSIFYLWDSNAAVLLGHGLLVVASLALAAGLAPRLAALVIYVLHVSFNNRNPMIAYGFDKVITFFMLYLTFAWYSSDEREAPRGSWKHAISSVAWRLIQIQLCVIYLFSGTEKLKGQFWWRGEALWGVLANSQLSRFDFGWTAHFPLLLTLGVYATLAFEIYFPVMVWSRRWKWPFLWMGVLLHVGIIIGMKLNYFGFVMILTYFVFFSRSEAQKTEAFVKGLFRRVLAGLLPRHFGREKTFKTSDGAPIHTVS